MDEPLSLRELWSPKGNRVSVWIREDTSDLSVLLSTFAWSPDGVAEDEYRLRDLDLHGWALDVGAHIGSVTLALLADHPDLRVIAVEPLPANVAMIERNVALNGWADRVSIRRAAVGADAVDWDYPGEPGSFERTNRYIGHLQQLTPTALSVTPVERLDLSILPPLAFAKWDCEGCEWSGLADARAAVVVGEWHGDPGIPGIHERLPGYEITTTDRGAAGLFFAVRTGKPSDPF